MGVVFADNVIIIDVFLVLNNDVIMYSASVIVTCVGRQTICDDGVVTIKHSGTDDNLEIDGVVSCD